MCKESRIAQKDVTYNFLTDEGKGELEFILMYVHKKHSLTSNPLMPHIASLLFLYLDPVEVYAVLSCMIEETIAKFKAKKQDKLRWYFTPDMASYS